MPDQCGSHLNGYNYEIKVGNYQDTRNMLKHLWALGI